MTLQCNKWPVSAARTNVLGFKTPEVLSFNAKRGRLAVKSKALSSGAADLPGCRQHGRAWRCSGFPCPSSDSEAGRCVSPHFAGDNGRQREEGDPSCAELRVFSKSPPAKHVQGCKGHLWQPEAGLSCKSLLLPKVRIGLIFPAPGVSSFPRRWHYWGADIPRADGSCTSATCPCCCPETLLPKSPPAFLVQTVIKGTSWSQPAPMVAQGGGQGGYSCLAKRRVPGHSPEPPARPTWSQGSLSMESPGCRLPASPHAPPPASDR